MRRDDATSVYSNDSPVGPIDEMDKDEMYDFQQAISHAFGNGASMLPQPFHPQISLDNSQWLAKTSLCSTHTEQLHPYGNVLTSLPRSCFSIRRKEFTGWRVGAVTCACTAAAVLTINFTLTVWASRSFPTQDGIGTIIEGKCSRVKTWGLWLHLAINALSTLLLGASNYCMQYLTAPTRQEIDRAHAKRKWLDIAVPSIRNLKWISWKRIIIWTLLGLRSVPLHLM